MDWTLFTFVILGWTKIVGIETGIVASMNHFN